jgi:hypothetical protein
VADVFVTRIVATTNSQLLLLVLGLFVFEFYLRHSADVLANACFLLVCKFLESQHRGGVTLQGR